MSQTFVAVEQDSESRPFFTPRSAGGHDGIQFFEFDSVMVLAFAPSAVNPSMLPNLCCHLHGFADAGQGSVSSCRRRRRNGRFSPSGSSATTQGCV